MQCQQVPLSASRADYPCAVGRKRCSVGHLVPQPRSGSRPGGAFSSPPGALFGVVSRLAASHTTHCRPRLLLTSFSVPSQALDVTGIEESPSSARLRRWKTSAPFERADRVLRHVEAARDISHRQRHSHGHLQYLYNLGALTHEVKYDSFITTMSARPSGIRRKSRPGLGSLITRELSPLRRLARVLDEAAQQRVPGLGREDIEALEELVSRASSLRRPDWPQRTIDAFNRLASREPIAFSAGALEFVAAAAVDLADPATWRWGASNGYALQGPRPPTERRVFVKSPSQLGEVVLAVVQYLEHPRRDRLKRCPRCRRWFIDATKNKSALRCSVACTIAWSNAQRGRKKTRVAVRPT